MEGKTWKFHLPITLIWLDELFVYYIQMNQYDLWLCV